MRTFNWVQKEKENGLIELYCYHTQQNHKGRRRRICSVFFAEPEDVEEAKKRFEENRRCVVKDGAWEPTEDAVWTFDGDRHGSGWAIDEKYIRAVV